MAKQDPPATPPANGDGQEPPAYVKHPDAGSGHLAQKIARIAGTVGVLSKDGTVTAGRSYGYATIGQMAAALAPRIADEGIAILPVAITDLQPAGTWEDEKFGVRWLTHVEVEWLITDGTTELRATTRGKSLDPNGSEKDTNQALTFARINLYKPLFHLSERGDDPEAKQQAEYGGSRARGSSSGTSRKWDGTIPDVTDATVSGTVIVLGPGRVGLSYEIQPRTVQTEVNGIVGRNGLGGVFDKAGRHYAIPEANTEQAVTLARALGLTIPPKVAERYPAAAPAPEAQTPPASGEGDPEPEPAPESGAATPPDVPADAEGVATEQIGFPTPEEAAAEQARRAANDPHA